MDSYADIMQHPRHMLQHHQPMRNSSRAAQFSAFAALTGFDEELSETARLTSPRAAMSEDELAALDTAFQQMLSLAAEQPAVTLTCFQPDARKAGGAYVTCTGRFRHYDSAEKMLYLTNGLRIPVQNICGITLASPAEYE
ncbi:MAG: hypothetical protein IJL32_08060 [Oscillospiraceae bacterium]|nr:hypothetical protein [Oscillospiraceae bacterium]